MKHHSILSFLSAFSFFCADGLVAEPGERELQAGGVTHCKYGSYHDDVAKLLPAQFIEQGQGICAGGYTFGITNGKGKLQLLKRNKVVWTAGIEGIDFCTQIQGGAFACYEGSRHGPSSNRHTLFALNCGGKHGSYMKLDKDSRKVLQHLANKRSWYVKKNGKEGGKCERHKPQPDGVKHCKFGSRDEDCTKLLPGQFIERGEGICVFDYTFGISHGKGKLQLLLGKKVLWTAGVEGIDFCSQNLGGSFACYEGSRHGPSSNRHTIFALNCGGEHGSYMKLDEDSAKVLQHLGNNKSWYVKKNGKEGGQC